MSTKQYKAITDWTNCRCEHCIDDLASELSKCALFPAYNEAVLQRRKDNKAKQ